MANGSRSALLRYGIALVSVGVAYALTMFVPSLRQRESFILFFGAVSVSAWYGGRGPGLLASLLSAALFDFLIFPPPLVVSLEPQALEPAFFFLAVAVMISSLTHGLARAEEIARTRQQLLEVTLSSIGDAVIATDAQLNVMFINEVARQLTGVTLKPTEARAANDVFRLTSQAENPIQRVLRDQRTVHLEPNALLLSSGGKALPIEGNAALIRHADGRVMGVVLVFRDVTERVQARGQILEYQQRLRSLAAELSLAEERERRDIATGLHDRIGQSLALTRIKLGSLRDRIADDDARTQVDEIKVLLKQIITEVRSLTFELSPPILYEFGLEAALEWLCENVSKQYGLPCSFQRNGERRPLRQEEFVPLFQATRELLTNIVKHAHARRATVHLFHEPGSVRVCVEDDGSGFDMAATVLAPDNAGGFGLFNIRERVSYLGGTFDLRSFPGQGTRVTLTLPVQP